MGSIFLFVLIGWKHTKCLQSWSVEWEKKIPFFSKDCAQSTLWKIKKPRKGMIESSVFLLISCTVLAWCKPAERLQSEYARCKRTWERGGWKDGRSVNVSLYLMLLSLKSTLQSKRATWAQTRNVQAPCDHLEQSSSPLSHFRPQMRASAQIMCVWAQWRFLFDLISPCMFKSVLLPKKGMWYGQKREQYF